MYFNEFLKEKKIKGVEKIELAVETAHDINPPEKIEYADIHIIRIKFWFCDPYFCPQKLGKVLEAFSEWKSKYRVKENYAFVSFDECGGCIFRISLSDTEISYLRREDW